MPQLMRMKPSVIPTCGAPLAFPINASIPGEKTGLHLTRIRHCIHNPQSFIPRWGTHQRNQSANEINSSLIATSQQKIQNAQGFCFVPQKNGERKTMWGPSGYRTPHHHLFSGERRHLQSVFLQHVGMCHHSTSRDDTPGSMKFGAAKDNRIFKSSNPTSFESNPEDLPMKKSKHPRILSGTGPFPGFSPYFISVAAGSVKHATCNSKERANLAKHAMIDRLHPKKNIFVWKMKPFLCK